MAEGLSWQVCPHRLWVLRTRSRDGLDALAPGLSDLPTSRCLRHGQALWMRLGPDEWWCQSGTEEAPPGLPERHAAGRSAEVLIDLSNAHVMLQLRGSVFEVLSQGCDLDFERLPPDSAVRTRCAAFTVVLCPQGDRLDVWIEASLAQSFQAWLQQAARF